MAKSKKNSGEDVVQHMTIAAGPEEIQVDENGVPVFDTVPLEDIPEEDNGVADGSGFNPE